jgi:hypothetical protein
MGVACAAGFDPITIGERQGAVCRQRKAAAVRRKLGAVGRPVEPPGEWRLVVLVRVGGCGFEASAASSQVRLRGKGGMFGLVAGLRGPGRVLWAGSRATDSSDSSERFPEDPWCAQKFRIARGRCFTCTEQSSRLEQRMVLWPKQGFVRESSEMGT